MTAIAGTFVKIEPVATRKVVRLHIECPIEMADQVLKSLGGYPDPANARWVGIAPLKAKPENTVKGGRLAQSAGILSDTPAFQRWVADQTEGELGDSSAAAEYIRARCAVSSRAHLDHDEEAARAFRDLKTEYEVWLKDAA